MRAGAARHRSQRPSGGSGGRRGGGRAECGGGNLPPAEGRAGVPLPQPAPAPSRTFQRMSEAIFLTVAHHVITNRYSCQFGALGAAVPTCTAPEPAPGRRCLAPVLRDSSCANRRTVGCTTPKHGQNRCARAARAGDSTPAWALRHGTDTGTTPGKWGCPCGVTAQRCCCSAPWINYCFPALCLLKPGKGDPGTRILPGGKGGETPGNKAFPSSSVELSQATGQGSRQEQGEGHV